jgi:hypothetical protein
MPMGDLRGGGGGEGGGGSGTPHNSTDLYAFVYLCI